MMLRCLTEARMRISFKASSLQANMTHEAICYSCCGRKSCCGAPTESIETQSTSTFVKGAAAAVDEVRTVRAARAS